MTEQRNKTKTENRNEDGNAESCHPQGLGSGRYTVSTTLTPSGASGGGSAEDIAERKTAT